MKIGEKILKSRKDKKMSQEDLAEKIGVTRQTISNWELGETTPNYEQVEILANTLDININELRNNNNYLKYKIIIGMLLMVTIILSIVIIYLLNDNKNSLKLHTTTEGHNTTMGITSKPNNQVVNTFIRTYKVEEIEKVVCSSDIDGCDDTTFDVTLSQYKKETVTMQISNNQNFKKLEKGKTYEFEFKMPGEIALESDNIKSLFAFANIVSIKETNKVGKKQIQEKVVY